MEKKVFRSRISVLLLIFIFSGTFLYAQDITGQWNSVLNVQGVSLKIIFHINKTDSGYVSTMDSPDQGAAGIPVASTTFDGSKLLLEIPAIELSYGGEWKTDSVVGTFRQGALSLPMTLNRTSEKVKP